MIIAWCAIEVVRFGYEGVGVVRKVRSQGRRERLDDYGESSTIADFIRSTYFVTAQIPILSALILFSEWRSKIVLDGSPNTSDALFVPIAVVVCIQVASLMLDVCENATLKLTNLAVQALSKLSLVIMVLMIIVRIFEAKKAAA